MSDVELNGPIRTPDTRRCECCGRVEHWDSRRTNWRLARAIDRRRVGEPLCIHEWNITGSFRTVRSE